MFQDTTYTKSVTKRFLIKKNTDENKIVNKKDGHPVRAGEKSIRFEVTLLNGDCGKIKKKNGLDDCKKMETKKWSKGGRNNKKEYCLKNIGYYFIK